VALQKVHLSGTYFLDLPKHILLSNSSHLLNFLLKIHGLSKVDLRLADFRYKLDNRLYALSRLSWTEILLVACNLRRRKVELIDLN